MNAFQLSKWRHVTSTKSQQPVFRADRVQVQVTAGARRQLGMLTFPRKSSFKTILAFDGGGLRGLVTAGLLEGVEEAIKLEAVQHGLTGVDAHGHRVKPGPDDEFTVLAADYFDIIAGTSTGAILAAYVASKGSQAAPHHASPEFAIGLQEAQMVTDAVTPEIRRSRPAHVVPGSAAALQALFMSTGDDIFPRRTFMEWFLNIFRPKYPALFKQWVMMGKDNGVEMVLQKAFGFDKDNILLTTPGVLDSSLIITAYQMDYYRPFIFYASVPDKDDEGGTHHLESGYAAMNRSLTPDESETASNDGRGLSDLVRVRGHKFKLWQAVRASTAAPTFFGLAKVDNLGNEDPKVKVDPLPVFKMTDGGVIANNPAMAAMTFASTKYKTAFVAPKGRPSIAVLSLGCGTSCSLAHLPLGMTGELGWIKGPIIDILQGGSGELNAAMNQQVARDWPGSGPCQWQRLQLTAGLNDNGKTETLMYADELVIDGKDNRYAPFKRALQFGRRNLSVNKVLANMDIVDQRHALLGMGVATAADKKVQDRMRNWVANYVLKT